MANTIVQSDFPELSGQYLFLYAESGATGTPNPSGYEFSPTISKTCEATIPDPLVGLFRGYVADNSGDMANNIYNIGPAFVNLLDDTNTYVLSGDRVTNEDLEKRTFPETYRDKLLMAIKSATIGTVASGATTTSVPSKTLSPSGTDVDQFKGLIMKFTDDTSTTGLRGQGAEITAYNSGVFSVSTLSSAPAEDDIFIIQ